MRTTVCHVVKNKNYSFTRVHLLLAFICILIHVNCACEYISMDVCMCVYIYVYWSGDCIKTLQQDGAWTVAAELIVGVEPQVSSDGGCSTPLPPLGFLTRLRSPLLFDTFTHTFNYGEENACAHYPASSIIMQWHLLYSRHLWNERIVARALHRIF